MYTGMLDAVANNETWQLAISCTDADSGQLIDLTGCLIEIKLKDENRSTVLSASTVDGGVVLTEPTVALLTVAASSMATLGGGTYLVGIRASLGGVYASLIAGSLPVIEGNTA